jgi:hypothetical protein
VRVVIVGARSRTSMSDTNLVNDIIDSCKTRYSNLIIVVSSCDKGVGKVVKQRNINQHTPGKHEFDMIEFQMKHYLDHELPQAEFTGHWIALNAAICEIGDEFHLLIEETPRGGAMYDLEQRVKSLGKTYATYKPSESKDGAKTPSFTGT